MRRKEGAFVAAQAAITVGVLALIALPLFESSQISPTSTSTFIQPPPGTYSSIPPLPGSPELQIQVWLNTTRIPVGGALGVRVSLSSLTMANYTILDNSSNPLLTQWGYDDFLCGSTSISKIIGFALFTGHYTSQNSSAATPLQLVPSVGLPCTSVNVPGSYSLTFLDGSDQALLGPPAPLGPPVPIYLIVNNASCQSSPGLGSGSCGPDGGLFGYWDATNLEFDNAPTSSSHFHPLPAGQYTLLAEDFLNQTDYAYFQVG